jgi:hypothetical protein
MRRILDDASAVGNATSRTLMFDARDEEDVSCCPGPHGRTCCSVVATCSIGRSHRSRRKASTTPSDRAAPTGPSHAVFYGYPGITPAMAMPPPGSAANIASPSSTRTWTTSRAPCRTRRTSPRRFWSLTLYDNQTLSILVMPQRFPRAGSQSYPTPAAVANPDGSTTVHFAPEQPAGIADGNCVQTAPGKGFFAILRLTSPHQPFFDRIWRVGEVEPQA